MSVIDGYVKDIEKLINQLPYRFSTKIHSENRGDVALYSTYPHHKHLKDKILPSKEMSLKEIINEIMAIISKR